MSEKAKRLAPTQDTLRQLFLLTGNQCAFPGCNQILINEKGEFVAQICHICAAEEGGERFDSSQSNEQRRAFENLLLLCYPHHVATNNVVLYTVDALKKMKAAHEDRYSIGIRKMYETVGDVTDRASATPPTTALAYHRWRVGEGRDKLDKDELLGSLQHLFQRLKPRPLAERSLLGIILKRGSYGSSHPARQLPLSELVEVSSESQVRTLSLLKLLEGGGFVYVEKDDEYYHEVIYVKSDDNGWDFFEDIEAYGAAHGHELTRVVEALDFSIFD